MTEQIDRKHQEDLQRLRDFRLLDDDFLTIEKIAEYAELPLDEVKKLKAERTA